MKKSISVTFMLFVFLFCSNTLWGQEKKNSISMNGSVAHYLGIDDFKTGYDEDSYKFPISLGTGVIYWRKFFSKIELGTGVSYQKVHLQSHVDISYGYHLKFQYNETSIPLLLKYSFPSKNETHGYFTLGFYNGKQQNVITEYPRSVGWSEWDDIKTIAGYSSDHFFTDIYFDAGYARSLKGFGEISIAPFFLYRINSTWINNYQKKLIVGIKLNYSLKF